MTALTMLLFLAEGMYYCSISMDRYSKAPLLCCQSCQDAGLMCNIDDKTPQITGLSSVIEFHCKIPRHNL